LGKFFETNKINNSVLKLICEKHNIIEDPYFFFRNEEIILINPYTMINYEIELSKSFHNIIYDLPFPIDSEEFYNCIIFLVQGIPSKFFNFDCQLLSFVLSNKSFRLMGTTNNLIENFVEEFINFGNYIFIIRSITEFYLFKYENTSYLLKRFFEFINDFLIKFNEKFINLKSRILYYKNLHLSGLAIKLKKYSELIYTIYSILNLPNITSEYKEIKLNEKGNGNEGDKKLNKNKNQINRNNFILINEFLEFYNQKSSLKTHYLLDTLFSIFYYFNVKNSNYYLTKNMLINTLKSYMRYLYFIIFNNEIIDNHENSNMHRNQNKIINPTSNLKIPIFLSDYRNLILRISILINLINKYDLNYLMICNLKLVDLLQYLENFEFDSSFINDSISEFISLKEKFFKMKYELIENYTSYEKVIYNKQKLNKQNYCVYIFLN